MSPPPEVAWLAPIVLPFLIGLVFGAIVKRTAKLTLLLMMLVVLLTVTGSLSISFSDLYEKAMDFLPNILDTGEALKDIIPYSSVSFIVGMLLGMWK